MAPTGAISKRHATVSLRFLCMTSLFSYAGLPQTREIGGFGQGTDLWVVVPVRLLHARQASVKGAQSLGFGERSSGALALAFEAVGGGKIRVHDRQARVFAIRLLQPRQRLVGA